jgi:methylmalonyl-CoA mutase N-terminal domain/subunit
VLGGTQSLHTNALDEALALPSETAARTALRTQQILAYESGVAGTADPVGGSYAIEEMTDRIESEAEEHLRRIDALGGMLRAIESGYIQREIQESAYRYQKSVEAGETVIVGVNRFTSEEETPVDLLVVDEAVGGNQRKRLEKLKATRDAASTARALEQLRLAAAGRENLVPHILNAVEALATVGEISDSMRKTFGEYRESVVV